MGRWRGRFTLIDIRDIEGEALLASAEPSDNVLGILTKLKDQRAAVRGILRRLSSLPPDEARFHYRALLILAGLRGLTETVREEGKQNVDVIDFILHNDLLAPAYKEGLEKGLEQGLEQGRQEGLQEGLRGVLQNLIQSRFGPPPDWLVSRLAQLSPAALNDLSVRLLEARTLEDLFPPV